MDLDEARRWGRVDDDGTVWLRTTSGERSIGTWQAGSPEEGLRFFARKYDDTAVQVTLLEQRVHRDPKRVRDSARRMAEELAAAAVVGDVAELARRLAAVGATAEELLGRERARRAEEAERATARKRALVEEAERLAGGTQWKSTGERLRAIVTEWSSIHGADRRQEAELWRRLVAARARFDRSRGAHFAALDEQRRAAAARKEELIAQAEQLSQSREWAPTARRYRELMTEWKAAGPAGPTAEPRLWERFRAAQDAFFARRSEVHAARHGELSANQEAREKVLAEAEQLDPADPRAARRLRELQEQWARTGPAPREAAAALDRRLEAVERRVREAADRRWQTRNPETSALVVRLRESIAKLEARLDRAENGGRAEEAEELRRTLDTQRGWLEQAQRSAG